MKSFFNPENISILSKFNSLLNEKVLDFKFNGAEAILVSFKDELKSLTLDEKELIVLNQLVEYYLWTSHKIICVSVVTRDIYSFTYLLINNYTQFIYSENKSLECLVDNAFEDDMDYIIGRNNENIPYIIQELNSNILNYCEPVLKTWYISQLKFKSKN